ncbi:hypothetical protein FKM82_003889 [Ascaphus truei]
MDAHAVPGVPLSGHSGRLSRITPGVPVALGSLRVFVSGPGRLLLPLWCAELQRILFRRTALRHPDSDIRRPGGLTAQWLYDAAGNRAVHSWHRDTMW